MSKYGIPYQGSKGAIAESIIHFLPKGKQFVDLFGGGFAMSHCALLSGKYEKVLYNELNPLLPKLILKAINGEYNYKRFKPKWISREDFFAKKDTDGYIKYIWSFGNDGETYLFAAELEPLKKSLHNFIVFGKKDDFIKQNLNDIDKYIKTTDIPTRRLLLRKYINLKRKYKQLQQLQQLERLGQLQRLERVQQLQQLQQLEIVCGNYLDYEYKDGDVVYCDPPYEFQKKYQKATFNHTEFYEWVASRPFPVYFSSYNNISDKRFNMVWAKGKANMMAGAKAQKQNYECIYYNGK